MLSCRAIAGIPTPSITWTRRDRRPLSHRVSEEYPGALTFRDVTLEEAGDYECQAENVAGKVSTSVALNIQQSPVITLNPNITEITITEGDELKIECSAIGIPPPSVIWKDPNEVRTAGFSGFHAPETRTSTAPYATIHKYNAKRSDEGTYICLATNPAGSDEKYVTVLVQQKRGDIGEYFNVF